MGPFNLAHDLDECLDLTDRAAYAGARHSHGTPRGGTFSATPHGSVLNHADVSPDSKPSVKTSNGSKL